MFELLKTPYGLAGLTLSAFLLGLAVRRLFCAIDAVLNFEEKSEKIRYQAEIIEQEFHRVIPEGQKLRKLIEEVGGDLWKIREYHNQKDQIEQLQRDVKRLAVAVGGA